MKADLHLHSYYSDGLVSPAHIAETCVKNGVGLAALTDHDNMNGCAEFVEECRKRDVKCVVGLEISAYDGDVKIHTLGYNVDTTCAQYKAFDKFVTDGAQMRMEEVLYKLKKIDYPLTMAEVNAQRHSPKSPYHIMHAAFAAAKKGYAPTAGEFYINYLAPGKPAFSNVGRPTPEYALDVIKDCGGFSSLAHPGRIILDSRDLLKLIQRMKACGLNGIEAVYSGHTMGETAYYKEIAEKYSLLVTGGSDTHYATGSRVIGVPEFHPSQELLSALKVI